ncbi:MAG TPA: hypothetical protein VGO56_00080 [Pyrinomonadaceae bacterium]|jgi:hypothetical protein|nr:hypothetical protein [Pyrinomonadaceae bacterium]
MKKEMLGSFTTLVLMLTIAIASSAVSVNAQTPTNKVVAKVPFEFSVGYKSMPAGEYAVQTISSASNGLLIQSTDGTISALRLSEETDRIKDKSQVRLVFHRYGEHYFLAEVWNGANTGRRLAKSQEESAIADEFTLTFARESAHAGVIYEIVEVLAVLR